jgi:hypothetical protein
MKFSCCQEETILETTIICSWYRNYADYTDKIADAKTITSNVTSLVYCLNFVGLLYDDVSASNYLYSAQIRMNGEY